MSFQTRQLAPAERAATDADLDALKQKAYHDLDEAELYAGMAVVYATRAGGRFLAMKELVERTTGYGSWGVWMEANLKLSARSVQFYMQCARAHPALADPDADIEQVLRSNAAARAFASLSLRRAMQRLAEPKSARALAAPASAAPGHELAADELAVLEQDARELTRGRLGMTDEQRRQIGHGLHPPARDA